MRDIAGTLRIPHKCSVAVGCLNCPLDARFVFRIDLRFGQCAEITGIAISVRIKADGDPHADHALLRAVPSGCGQVRQLITSVSGARPFEPIPGLHAEIVGDAIFGPGNVSEWKISMIAFIEIVKVLVSISDEMVVSRLFAESLQHS
jgi:hypothetical protein